MFSRRRGSILDYSFLWKNFCRSGQKYTKWTVIRKRTVLEMVISKDDRPLKYRPLFLIWIHRTTIHFFRLSSLKRAWKRTVVKISENRKKNRKNENRFQFFTRFTTEKQKWVIFSVLGHRWWKWSLLSETFWIVDFNSKSSTSCHLDRSLFHETTIHFLELSSLTHDPMEFLNPYGPFT